MNESYQLTRTGTNALLRRGAAFKERALVLLCMYLGYAGFMILKTSIVVSAPAILADPTTQLNTADWGSILAAGTFGGILGKFMSGWSADRWGGKKTFTLGLMVSSLGVSQFSFRSEFVAFAGIYFTILLANSSGWPSMAKLISNWFDRKQYGRVWGLISTSSRVGTISATFTVAALLRVMEWRQVLWVAAGIGGCLFLMVFLILRERPRLEADPPIEFQTSSTEASSFAPHPFRDVSLGEAVKHSLGNQRFLLMAASMMGLTILWDFLNFVPLYLKDSLQISVADAAMATSAFPIGSLVSVLIGGVIFDKLPKHRITVIIGLYLGIAVSCLIFLMILPGLGFTDQAKVMATLLALFIFGFTVSPAYYLPMSIFAIDYGGRHSGFLIALLDAIGYLASIAFSFGGGRLLQSSGSWSGFLMVLIGVAGLAWILTVSFLHGEDRHHNLRRSSL